MLPFFGSVRDERIKFIAFKHEFYCWGGFSMFYSLTFVVYNIHILEICMMVSDP
uniref:Uncharacterized protein n=1 Tax=Manihot esculenta TaxID=3983 RepID=A0A2C9V5V9_MANES